MTGRPMSNEVTLLAREWLGTPYHHQASVKGVGCDCLGLIRGIWRELYGSEPQELPAYTPDWGEVATCETLLDAAHTYFRQAELEPPAPGAVVVFRMRAGAMAKHAGLISGPDKMIHAQEGAGVVEVPYSGWWQRRAVAAFCFPDR
ncbi:NlpC/P60 family protein [Polycladidibacter hongkongensis]|uniref:NlpC/P60 family protein n=1 Tax=Polycladidibacter hongkongensis TaxID=1647556 RepID=UPI00082D5EFB|nr:NlpC/P60 family protein [Pseudovibrio hongkongensis]